jgi:hypothetical protein
MVFNSMRSLFLNTLMFVGLFNACRNIYAIPVNLFTPSSGGTIQYPIYIACECEYSLYVDGKNIQPDNTKVETFDYLETGWNVTKKFYPYIYDESPKIIAFNGISGQYAGLLNGFIMDMNNGEDYTRYEDWKCADFSNTASKVPPVDWFTYDYDDSEWRMSTSFGKNYQNNSFQIFETERREINLQAEWIWTSDNTVTNVYCRKKNENVMTITLSTSAPPTVSPTIHTSHVQTSAPRPVQTSAPLTVSPTIHTSHVQTSAPHSVQTSAPLTVSPTIHTSHVQTSAPLTVSPTIHTSHVQTSAPHPVQTSAPHPVQTSAPHSVQTSAPPTVSPTIHTSHVQTSAPHPVQTSAPHPVQTSAPHPVQTSAPHSVQTSAPHSVQTSAPPTVSPTIHTSHVQTSAPHPVQTSAPHSVQTSAPHPVQTSAPHSVQTSAPHPVPTIVISPHIQIIIQNVKFSQRLSNTHVDNLFRKLSLYRDEYKLYKLLTIARLHLKQHYNALFYDIKHILEKQNIYDATPTIHKNPVRNIPRYLQSMHTLNISIKKIEDSIQFIKGNHKYILLGILDKLKIQYQQDTQKLLTLITNT